MCLAPIVLLGYLLTLHPNQSHPTSMNSPMVEIQSCEQGLGVQAKASERTASLGFQYGLVHHMGEFSIGFTPNLGVGFLSDRIPELSSQVNFSLGAQAFVGYRRARIAVEYWHQSNANLGNINAGLDMIGLMGGWSF